MRPSRQAYSATGTYDWTVTVMDDLLHADMNWQEAPGTIVVETSSTGISMALIAGIVAILAIVIIAALYFLMKKRKKSDGGAEEAWRAWRPRSHRRQRPEETSNSRKPFPNPLQTTSFVRQGALGRCIGLAHGLEPYGRCESEFVQESAGEEDIQCVRDDSAHHARQLPPLQDHAPDPAQPTTPRSPTMSPVADEKNGRDDGARPAARRPAVQILRRDVDGDWGISYLNEKPVLEEVGGAIKWTVLLLGTASIPPSRRHNPGKDCRQTQGEARRCDDNRVRPVLLRHADILVRHHPDGHLRRPAELVPVIRLHELGDGP